MLSLALSNYYSTKGRSPLDYVMMLLPLSLMGFVTILNMKERENS